MNTAGFIGDAEALKYAVRDLATVDQVLREAVSGRTAVIQAGGNLGVFPKHLSQSFDAVYTFEPDPRCFRAMTANAPEPNIYRMQAALGCERGKLVSTKRSRRDGKTNVHDGVTHIAGEGLAPTFLIDDMGLRILDLLYLDLEGYEYFALKGAAATLQRCRPTVVVEINQHLKEYLLEPEDIHAFMRLHEYEFHGKVRSDFVFVPRDK